MRHSTTVALGSIAHAMLAGASSSQALFSRHLQRGPWTRTSLTKRSIFVAPTVAVWLLMQAASALAQAPVLQANPQIQVTYTQPRYNSSQYAEFTVIYEWLRVRRPLDEIQKFLAPLRLPRQIKI